MGNNSSKLISNSIIDTLYNPGSIIPMRKNEQAFKIENFSWMAQLPDSLLLSALTIPGTHNSCSYQAENLFIESWVKCQNFSIRQQLNMGVRFFDIRCRAIDDNFTIHHGSIYLKLNFEEVLKDLCAYLEENPTECLLMRIKEEYKTKNCYLQFHEIFYIYFNEEYAKNHFYANAKIPTLGEVRGKIILLRDFSCSYNDNTGIFWSDFYLMDIKDNWKEDNELAKLDDILNHFKKNDFPERTQLSIIFCSIGEGKIPKAAADKINPLVTEAPYTYMGIVVLDFITQFYTSILIGRNQVFIVKN